MRKLMASIERHEVFPKRAQALFDVDKLIALAAHHPNGEYVASVGRGLKEGVWSKFDKIIEKEGNGFHTTSPYPSLIGR
jgi:hypothetical protein